ncbi:oxidoreductase [Pandoraea vervacti]|uniref:Oxidoreductase n=1 Tax=Pandoraea vervacti TaxID=656178 RepID=A0ABM5T461_9BURK|nr:oxidoreductase [Pandoraea vervacti]
MSVVEPPAERAGPTCCAFPVAENRCRIVSHERVNDEYRHLVALAPQAAATVRPGQFFHLRCPSVGDDTPFLRRPMSLYRSCADKGTIEFLYKVQGAGTRGLASLSIGDTLDAMGPVGNGFSLPQNLRHLLLLARGVGLATLAPLAQAAVERGARVTAILSARNRSLVMSDAYLRAVGANVIVVTDEDGNSTPAHIEAILRSQHESTPFDRFATCGSNRLLLLLQKLGAQLGVRGEIALEQHMGCALGACYACVRPFRKTPHSDELSYRRVCWDGPVFDLQETVTW